MRLRLLVVATAAALTTLALPSTTYAAPSQTATLHRAVKVCAAPNIGYAACQSWVRTDIAPLATPSGFGPSSLRAAYNLGSASGSGRTVAIVDAYDDPTAEADLGVYRSQFGLSACTTANGCFRKIDQRGGTAYPRKDAGWALEISLDVDMVSAICQDCHILLVEADTNSFANLGAAVNQAAATSGVVAISLSWGGSDVSDGTYGSFFNHPGKAITASSGDGGFGVIYPSSSHYTTSVGGTSLTQGGGTRGWTESAWSGAGSGCSGVNTALASAPNVCNGKRATSDVSAVADPNTGVAVYDTTRYQGLSGWFVVGGTSASSPIIASVFALAGNTASIDNNYPYNHSGSLYDVTTGSNGNNCSPSSLCHAGVGWDGPTGLGTPNGTGAF
jgi:subtilase family serine protease